MVISRQSARRALTVWMWRSTSWRPWPVSRATSTVPVPVKVSAPTSTRVASASSRAIGEKSRAVSGALHCAGCTVVRSASARRSRESSRAASISSAVAARCRTKPNVAARSAAACAMRSS